MFKLGRFVVTKTVQDTVFADAVNPVAFWRRTRCQEISSLTFTAIYRFQNLLAGRSFISRHVAKKEKKNKQEGTLR